MSSKVWDALQRSAGPGSVIWEEFHRNTKMGRFGEVAPREMVLNWMDRYTEALDYEHKPRVPLPPRVKPLRMSLGRAVRERETVREFDPKRPLAFEDAAAILHYAYGVNRSNQGTEYTRPFRNAPSGGALYPLEIYFHATNIQDLAPGLYHFNPTDPCLRLLAPSDQRARLGEILVQPELLPAAMMIFITAQFERSLFKYRDRGYRFILLEAGHVAQNMNLAATALGLGSVNIGGYFDRRADDLLGLDGLTHSTVYMVGIGPEGG